MKIGTKWRSRYSKSLVVAKQVPPKHKVTTETGYESALYGVPVISVLPTWVIYHFGTRRTNAKREEILDASYFYPF